VLGGPVIEVPRPHVEHQLLPDAEMLVLVVTFPALSL
jgi:hypothetical protein